VVNLLIVSVLKPCVCDFVTLFVCLFVLIMFSIFARAVGQGSFNPVSCPFSKLQLLKSCRNMLLKDIMRIAYVKSTYVQNNTDNYCTGSSLSTVTETLLSSWCG
jgi:hypothetical protein